MIFIDIYSSISERKAKGVCQRLSIICKGDQTFTGLCCESTIYLLFDLDEPSRLLFWTIRNSHISVDFARLKSHSRNDMIIRWWFRIDCQANFLHGISHHRLRFSESNLSRCEIAVCHDGKQKTSSFLWDATEFAGNFWNKSIFQFKKERINWCEADGSIRNKGIELFFPLLERAKSI